MIDAFKNGKDIYATIASVAFNVPYEQCLEFHPETREYQPEGKERRSQSKSIVLGICYGRSVPSIGDQLFGKRKDMTDEQKTKEAQKVYDAVLAACPGLRSAMLAAQKEAHDFGYVTTIVGSRRHIPEMMLDEFEFEALPGYVNPDIDPLNPDTLNQQSSIPSRVIAALKKEFSQYKYFGQIAKRTKQLYEEEHIKVINNRAKITEASRKTLNCVDLGTEILTTSGWKRYDEVARGDQILSYNLDKQEVETDTVLDVHISKDPVELVHFDTPTFESYSTPNHRWVVCDAGERPKIKTTADLLDGTSALVLLGGGNSFANNAELSDTELIKLGESYQRIPHSLISTLSQGQCLLLLESVLKRCDSDDVGHAILPLDADIDALQHLAFRAGHSTQVHPERSSDGAIENYHFWINFDDSSWVSDDAISRLSMNGCWCVTTNNGTWVARTNGKVYITGNSKVQGQPYTALIH